MANMMRWRCWAPAAAGLVAACSGGNYRPVSDFPVRIGKPYTVRGITYVPAEDTTYDMLGYASWYGNESGKRTQAILPQMLLFL